jgi:hypothetical protein
VAATDLQLQMLSGIELRIEGKVKHLGHRRSTWRLTMLPCAERNGSPRRQKPSRRVLLLASCRMKAYSIHFGLDMCNEVGPPSHAKGGTCLGVCFTSTRWTARCFGGPSMIRLWNGGHSAL